MFAAAATRSTRIAEMLFVHGVRVNMPDRASAMTSLKCDVFQHGGRLKGDGTV